MTALDEVKVFQALLRRIDLEPDGRRCYLRHGIICASLRASAPQPCDCGYAEVAKAVEFAEALFKAGPKPPPKDMLPEESSCGCGRVVLNRDGPTVERDGIVHRYGLPCHAVGASKQVAAKGEE